jgi:hypothetical protein
MKHFILLITILLFTFFVGCNLPSQKPKASSGVTRAKAKVVTQVSGLTIEQENIKKRLEVENMPGAIKHLYVISAMSGQVLIYSTVKGKVTSSGKRLTPYQVGCTDNQGCSRSNRGMPINISNVQRRTPEVLQDDGTYGHSIPYLYWWDTQGRYHQHYVSGGQIIHVAEKPINVKSIIINVDK